MVVPTRLSRARSRSYARPWYWSLALLMCAALLISACGGGDPEPVAEEPVAEDAPAEDAPAEEPAPEDAPDTVTGGAADGAVTELDGIRDAVIQIVSQGTFVDPQFGLQLNAAGSGSGFIIDPSGLAVTNNHVVTGAALVEVYIEGENEPRNARILGVSECSDLAVIDIDGEGFPYLQWYAEEPRVGLEIYAAGFPLGDPEFTLTRGIVSKESADGESDWASVNEVLEHDATINPGNSGGPLVDGEGRVVGVNYSGNSETSQFFAISANEALGVLEVLSDGEDIDSIGINGQAVLSDDGALSGIWVSSVQTGSPASNAGVEPGDIITSLEGLVLATDGTMSDYCDVLRSRDADDIMAIEVVRFETEESLSGELNGTPLETTFSFAQEFAEDTPADAGGDSDQAIATYASYSLIQDDTNALQIEIPDEWADINNGTWSFNDQPIGRFVNAAPNLDNFYNTWTTPGVFFGVSSSLVQELDEAALLAENSFDGDCTYGERSDYDDGLYTGLYDVWTNCGGTDTAFYVIVITPEDRSFMGIVQIQVVEQRDLEALDRIIQSFQVVGALP